MKTVFSTNGMAAHIWGQQTQECGRSPIPSGGGRFGFSSGAASSDVARVSFRDNICYSYHEPVARLEPNASGALCLLSTSKTWSPSTSGHVSSMIGAVSHLIDRDSADSKEGRWFEVPHIGGHSEGDPNEGWKGTPCAVDHIGNLAFLAQQYLDAVAHYEGRAKIHPEWISGVAYDAPESVARYYTESETVERHLLRKWAKPFDYADSFLDHCGADKYATIASLPKTFNAVKKEAARIIALREKRAADALARLTPKERARREAAKVERARLKKESDALRYADAADKLAGWKQGLRVAFGLPRSDSDGGAYIRAVGVKRDKGGAISGGRLETSQGATVPLVEAVKVFQFAKLCRTKGSEWQRNGKRVRVGDFQLDRIESTGSFVAGCHRINWPEIEALAVELGVIALEASDSVVEGV